MEVWWVLWKVCVFYLSTGLAGIREQQGERNKSGQETNEKSMKGSWRE